MIVVCVQFLDPKVLKDLNYIFWERVKQNTLAVLKYLIYIYFFKFFHSEYISTRERKSLPSMITTLNIIKRMTKADKFLIKLAL